MSGRYAERTPCTIRETLDEIEALIKKHRGSGVQCATSDEAIAILFAGTDRRVRFVMKFEDDYEQGRRAQARALLLAIKSKFVSVQAGIETFEEAFLAQTVMPDGKTVIEHAGPLVIKAYNDGGMPPALLPDYSA